MILLVRYAEFLLYLSGVPYFGILFKKLVKNGCYSAVFVTSIAVSFRVLQFFVFRSLQI